MSYYPIGSPVRPHRVHQVISSKVFRFVADHLDNHNVLLPLYEAGLNDADPRTLAPDISIFDKSENVPVVCIQFYHNRGLSTELKTNTRLMAEYESVEEVFLICYKETGPYTYDIKGYSAFKRRGDYTMDPGYWKGKLIEGDSSSEILGINFRSVLEKGNLLFGL